MTIYKVKKVKEKLKEENLQRVSHEMKYLR